MKLKYSIVLFFFVFLFLGLFLLSGKAPVLAQCNIAYCNACIEYDPAIQKYKYQPYKCTASAPVCQPYSTSQNGGEIQSVLPLNTNPTGTWGCSGPPPPSGCGQGYQCEGPGPTYPPGGCPGGQTGVCQQYGHVCCNTYPNGTCCSQIGAGCKAIMGCPSGATPTPTPYCTLSCPGQGGSQVGGGAGSVGTQESKPIPTGFEPPDTTGNIIYQGFNNFVCGLFKNGLGFNGACPPNLPLNTFQQPVRYHMLCGGTNYTYTAQVDSSAAGGGLEPTPTGGLTPTPDLYPPDCILNPSRQPTPTPIPGLGGGTSPNYCSCAVTLGCQTQLYPVESSNCTGSCNTAISPNSPAFSENVNFYITGTPNSINFDDGTNTVNNPSGTVEHTFANAGVYNVALTCGGGAQVCQKKVNIYCTSFSSAWYKVKDASFHKRGVLTNMIPTNPTAFGSDDSGLCDQSSPSSIRCFDINQPGVITAQGNITLNNARVSFRGWERADINYTPRSFFDPNTFLEYVKARKDYATITDLSQIQSNKINVIDGSAIFDSNFNNGIQGKAPFVLIVNGNLAIDINNKLNPSDRDIAVIVTGALNISSTVNEMTGIYLASSVDFAYDVPAGTTVNQTLKIKGNFASFAQAECTAKRARTSQTDKPTCFFVFDPSKYATLWSLLSTRTYEWKELAP